MLFAEELKKEVIHLVKPQIDVSVEKGEEISPILISFPELETLDWLYDLISEFEYKGYILCWYNPDCPTDGITVKKRGE